MADWPAIFWRLFAAGFFFFTSNYPINADNAPIKPEFCFTPQAPEEKHDAQIYLGMFGSGDSVSVWCIFLRWLYACD
jgi:hypothetical protein